MKSVAVKHLHVDVWTNVALRRAVKVLKNVVEQSADPMLESVGRELSDLLDRRRREHVGYGPAAHTSWHRAEELTEQEGRRRRIIERGHHEISTSTRA